MRTLLFAALVTLFATVVSAASVGNLWLLGRDAFTFNPINIHLKDLIQHKPIVLTNAQRLALGLGPARPNLRFNRRRGNPSATPTSASDTGSATPIAPSSSASPTSTASTAPTATCTAHVGSLKITGGSYTGSYVSAQANVYGEYGYTTSASDALQAQYTLCDGEAAGSPRNILALNGLTTYPYLGAVVGFASTSDDLSTGSYNYAYIVGTGESDPGATPQSGPNAFSAATGTPRDYESAVWVFDAATGAVTAQWVNTDGSKPTTHVVYVPGSGAFAITSDVQAFEANFGDVTEVSFTFVAASTSPVTATTSVV